MFDFEGKINNKEFKGSRGNDETVVLGSKKYIPGYEEQMENWPDFEEKLDIWGDAFSTQNCNMSGKIERKQNFSKPRTEGRSTRRRKLQ